MPDRSRRPPFNACLNYGDRPRINVSSLWLRAKHVQRRNDGFEWDGDADNGDADTVAKFLKCHAINFQQIDQTRAVDLTFAAPGWPPCSERGAGMMRSAVSAAQITTAR